MIDLRLDANEGAPADVALLESLREQFPLVASRYPDASLLEEQLAVFLGLSRERVAVTAGADDALERLCRLALEPGRTAAMTAPTFGMLRKFVHGARGEVREVAWMTGAFPAAALAERADAALAFVVTPNNPTGGVASLEDLRALRQHLPEALLVVDHAYVEFADDDLTHEALALPNVVVVRTLSKAWGLAGLRVGYMLGEPRMVARVRAIGLPYAISGPSVLVATRALASGAARMRAHVARVRREVATLTTWLRDLGAEPLPSQANFVLARFADAAGTARRLAERGIAVRTFAGDTRLQDCLRISCPGDDRAMQRLRAALASAP